MTTYEKGQRVLVKDGNRWRRGKVAAPTKGPATRVEFDDGAVFSVSNKLIKKED